MKKHLYLLLPLLTLHPTLATQKVVNSLIIASTLALSPTTQQPNLDTQPPRNLHDLDEKHILNLILNNYLRKAKLNKHLPNELQRLIHTFFIHEWTIHGLHKDTGTTYDPHDFDISGIHKQTKTNLDPSGFKQNSDYKDVSPKTNKPTKYDLQGYNIDRWNKDGLHQNGDKLNDDGFAQHVNHASIHLHTAIENLDKSALTLLLKNPNINVNLQNNDGWTPLIRCAYTGDDALKIAEALLKHKNINVNLKDKLGWTPLIMCCQEGQKSLQIAQELLGHKNINVNLQDKLGWTPLIRCCWKGDKSLQIAQALLKRKDISVNLQKNDDWTPLMWCCLKGDDALQIAQELLKHKHINVNLQTKNGTTPLIMCCETGDKLLNLAKILINHPNIDVNFKVKGWDPLLWCLYYTNQSLGIAQALLNHPNIDVNVKDKWWSYTPLDYIIHHLLKQKPNHEYVQLWNLLVAQGALLNKQKKAYHHLNPNHFQEPQKSYVQAIKNNPPTDLKLSSLTQENEHLRKQLEKFQKQKKVLSSHYTNAHHITNPLVLIAGASTYNKQYQDLPGARKDMELCNELFGNTYKYHVVCTYDKNNPSTTSLTLKRFECFVSDGHTKLANNEKAHRNKQDKKNQYDALIFIWAGHGGDGTFITSDGKTTKIDDLQRKFNGKNARFFLDKPKIIIKAACRGSQLTLPIMENTKRGNKSTKRYHVDAEFTYIFATTTGNQVFDLGYEKGSYLVPNLCKILKDPLWNSKEIAQITTQLGNIIREASNGCECLEFKSTKTKSMFFCKNNTNTKFMDHEEETKEDE